ncbi:M23 family metallopeptidase [Nocardioides sp. YIM 152315]|uniref:M23 family metallopeptidase n=1 Tax=Nocardioides sp. YIM 152315 TaxID=3031760 RepID=UPI0023DB7885|nr:M23 family metallopeptidase [Nocardioides sp. YIM 152315]MDF1604964.1 M23 family metallopeptidase [Nocardioides sp. YIM 152315]
MNALRRRTARLRQLWLVLFVTGVVLTSTVLDTPWWPSLAVLLCLLALAFVGPPRGERAPVETGSPVRGRWVAVNGPGSRVPSHGVRSYGQAYAVDVLHPSPSGAPARIGWGVRTRAPASYSSFGEPVLAVADGTVVAVLDRKRDHRSRDTWPTLVWMMVVEAFFRELGGAAWILGNHVVVDHGDGVWSAYAHLRRDSAAVRVGERVQAGQRLAEVGNTGNTTEPHLHFQLMDAPHVTGAAGLPWRWRGVTELEATDPARASGGRRETALEDVPENGRIFEVAVGG